MFAWHLPPAGRSSFHVQMRCRDFLGRATAEGLEVLALEMQNALLHSLSPSNPSPVAVTELHWQV